MKARRVGINHRGPARMPPHRPLRVYAFDPTRGHTLGNHMTIEIPYEDLAPGPIGDYLEVIDFDATNNCYYLPVDLDDPKVMLNGGLEPSESNPYFHQQMVYAVASQTIARFELALGRRIRWKAKWIRRRTENEPDLPRLRIFPHGMMAANAFFSSELGALVFGYFSSANEEPRHNLPGQLVFTCLSHDIVAHETTHALVDDQREYFGEATSEDTLAFHEAFADIVALFQHFTFKEPLQEMIRKTGGEIFRRTLEPEILPDANGPLFQSHMSQDNPLVDLAVQFGEAMGMRGALRSALGSPPNANDIEKYHEPHLRGSILVAAVFDAFFTIYVARTSDLMRIARASGYSGPRDALQEDIVNRLADTASKTAEHFLNICVRAFDYCPVVDIRFGDFLRAMITADFDLYPTDHYGYRAALIDACRSRGIVPEGAKSYSEEALLWESPEVDSSGNPPICRDLHFFRKGLGPKERDNLYENNCRKLNEFAKRNAAALGLADLFEDKKLAIQPIWNEMHRTTEDGRIVHNIVARLYQKTDVILDPDNAMSSMFPFRGGTVLIFDDYGYLRYIIKKRIDSKSRLYEQREFLKTRQNELGIAPYSLNPSKLFDKTFKVDFGSTHRGY
jgi:hypothetical protein